MKPTRQYLSSIAATSLFAFSMGLSAQASALLLTPADMISENLGNSNCEPGCVYTALGLTNASGAADDLVLYYKSDVSGTSGAGSDSGSYAGSYVTTFSNAANDPADALIDYISGASMGCPECYLAVKDGNHNPSYYFYDLAAWNGTDDISLKGFWPNGGAISHVSIWGREDGGGGGGGNIPEPASLLLMGAGLIGFGLARRRKAA